jgi:hypothetical protein
MNLCVGLTLLTWDKDGQSREMVGSTLGPAYPFPPFSFGVRDIHHIIALQSPRNVFRLRKGPLLTIISGQKRFCFPSISLLLTHLGVGGTSYQRNSGQENYA